MTQSAVSTKHLGTGREQRTDGLWKHLGLIDGSTLRATNNLLGNLTTGAGLELLYDPPSLASYIQSYDRAANAYVDLVISAKTLNLNPQGGGSVKLNGPVAINGTVTMPNGTITTPMLAVNAVQQRIASYQAAPGWNTSATGWQETIIQASGTSTGVDTRLEANIVWSHSAVGAGVYFAFYIDGVSYGGALSTVSVQAANYAITTSMLLYGTLPVGSHRFAVGVNNTVGTFSIFTGGASVLYVTEQKR